MERTIYYYQKEYYRRFQNLEIWQSTVEQLGDFFFCHGIYHYWLCVMVHPRWLCLSKINIRISEIKSRNKDKQDRWFIANSSAFTIYLHIGIILCEILAVLFYVQNFKDKWKDNTFHKQPKMKLRMVREGFIIVGYYYNLEKSTLHKFTERISGVLLWKIISSFIILTNDDNFSLR